MNSPELLLLVENCPKGAETLVTRCLHILTDKGKIKIIRRKRVKETTNVSFQDWSESICEALKQLFFPPVPPSPELVERVRDLYHKRVPDVRFLIPVINGLEKVPLGSSGIPKSQNLTFNQFLILITHGFSRTRSSKLFPNWSSSTPLWSKRCLTACWARSTVSI